MVSTSVDAQGIIRWDVSIRLILVSGAPILSENPNVPYEVFSAFEFMFFLNTASFFQPPRFCVERFPAKSSWTRFLPKILTNLPKILTNLPKILPNLPKACPRSCPKCQDYAGQFLAKILAKILPKIWQDLSLLARSCSSWQEPCPRTFCWVLIKKHVIL